MHGLLDFFSRDDPTAEAVAALRARCWTVPSALRGSGGGQGACASPGVSRPAWNALMERLLEWDRRTVRVSVKGASAAASKPSSSKMTAAEASLLLESALQSADAMRVRGEHAEFK